MASGDRIAQLMRKRGLTQADLMRATGATRGTVSQWISNATQPGGKYINELCRVLGTTSDYIYDGVDGEHEVGELYRPTRGVVPLISSIQARGWRHEEDEYPPGEAKDWLPCPVKHGKHTYALIVEGESMTAPHGKSYPHGSIIYVDPDQAGGVVSGDRVVAKINGNDEVTFKQLVVDSGKTFLRPLNPSYPIITDHFRILGKVIGTFIPE
jgi:SOS-response transcriptional repressor LexA